MNNNQNFLILGSSGFVGKNISSFLQALGHKVFEFDISRDISQDLRVPGNRHLSNLLSRIDFVIFLAFDVGGSKYIQKADNRYDFISNNLKIMTNVFEQLHVYEKPFIFVSSQLANSLTLNYGLLKLIGERITTSLGGVCVRIWNVYGKEEVSDKSHLITDLVYQARSRGKIELLTNGNEERQFIHIEDCCHGFLNIIQEYEIFSKVPFIDLTSFEWVSVFDVAKLVKDLTNCELVISDKEGFNSRVQEPNRRLLNYWSPKISLTQGIKNFIEEI